ncbi:MAG: orotidine-5'-phosphate decarboxylase [Deltaproteobacteria bacterium]|nr:orotidine-5'-phosphate decarboxylase [Deltaproteobacteria bacterium]
MKSSKLIIALDTHSFQKAQEVVDALIHCVAFFKVGKELFTAVGPDIVHYIKGKGGRVFLDLKFHDIPATVKWACLAACGLGVDMLTVHAGGGSDMLKAAHAGCLEAKRPDVITLAVTVLTSINDTTLNREMAVKGLVRDHVLHLAKIAKAAGMKGVIASPHEAAHVRKECGTHFMIVTPGVRPEGAERHDQQRTMTPLEAVRAGADYIVIGRPVTQAADPRRAAEKILDSIN